METPNMITPNTSKKASVELILDPCNYEIVNIDEIAELPSDYPEEFKLFCQENDLKPPKIETGNGKALAVMLKHKYCYCYPPSILWLMSHQTSFRKPRAKAAFPRSRTSLIN